MKFKKGGKCTFPENAKKIKYSVIDDLNTKNMCDDKYHNGRTYYYYGTKTIKGIKYAVFDEELGGSMEWAWYAKMEDLEAIFSTEEKESPLKKGSTFILPSKKITVWIKGWENIEQRDCRGKQQVFGFIKKDGQTWVQFESPSYALGNYWHTPLSELELLLNIKTTKMTKTTTKMTTIPAVKAKKFPQDKLVNGQAISIGAVSGVICKEAGNVYVCTNSARFEGSTPTKLPVGYKNGWTLGGYPNVDLTCGKTGVVKLGPAKAVAGEEQFCNTFTVMGSKGLLKAFAEEAIELGWKQHGKVDFTSYKNLYFHAAGDIIMKGQMFREDGINGGTSYMLPLQWDLALSAAKQKKAVSVIPDYIKAIASSTNITKGRFYEVIAGSSASIYKFKDDAGKLNGWGAENFVAATKTAFTAQKPLFVPLKYIGDWAVKIKTATVTGYDSIPVICIGCTDSQQVYTKESLKTILCTMTVADKKTVRHCDRAVTFTPDMVKTLIKMLEMA